jgi:hypothetical protein
MPVVGGAFSIDKAVLLKLRVELYTPVILFSVKMRSDEPRNKV